MKQPSREQKFIEKLEEARQVALRLSESAAERERGLAARLHDAQQVALRMNQVAAERERHLAAKLHDAQQVVLRVGQAAAERECHLEVNLRDAQEAAAQQERSFETRLRDLELRLTAALAAVAQERSLAEALHRQAKFVRQRLRDLEAGLAGIAVSYLTPPLPASNGAYRLADFDAYHGEAFTRIAYQALLRREPDAGGLEYYRGRLRQGIARTQILGEIRYSTEGRAAGVRVAGLASAYALHRAANLPVVGVFFRVLLAISYLLRLERKQTAMESRLAELTEQHERTLAHYLDNIRSAMDSMMSTGTETLHHESGYLDDVRRR